MQTTEGEAVKCPKQRFYLQEISWSNNEDGTDVYLMAKADKP